MQSKATTISEYLEELPADRRAALSELRTLIHRVAPKAVEAMQYGLPAFGDLCALTDRSYPLVIASHLSSLLKLAAPVLGSTDLPVEIEYGPDVAAQYHLSDIAMASNELQLVLVGKQTDCLAKESCGSGECNTSGCCQ